MSKPIFWVDLEMTGLDDKVDAILEIAMIVTDYDLKSIGQYHRVVYQPPEVLARMNDWCKKTHGESGLTASVPSGIPLGEAEKELIAFMAKFAGDSAQANKGDGKADDRAVLAGNSVWNDRRFLDAQMPEFAKKLHYRMIDVSSYKEIFRQKYGLDFKKADSHRALNDIEESIRELAYYLSFVKIEGKV